MPFRVYSRIRIKDMPKALMRNYRKVDTPKATPYRLHTGIDPLVGLPLIAGVYGSGATESKVSVVSDHRAYFIFSKNENRY